MAELQRIIRREYVKALCIGMMPYTASFSAALLDFEPPDATFSGRSYVEGGKSYNHDAASNQGDTDWGMTGNAASGSQCLWVDIASHSGSVSASIMARAEWHLGRAKSNQDVWYSYYLKFDSQWQNPGVYSTIVNQVRYVGSGYGFNGCLAIGKASKSGAIPLVFRTMTGGSL